MEGESSANRRKQTNCLTEIFFADALQRAADLDAHYNSTSSVKGPLHGLPISLKVRELVQPPEKRGGRQEPGLI
jgi:amidase